MNKQKQHNPPPLKSKEKDRKIPEEPGSADTSIKAQEAPSANEQFRAQKVSSWAYSLMGYSLT